MEGAERQIPVRLMAHDRTGQVGTLLLGTSTGSRLACLGRVCYQDYVYEHDQNQPALNVM